MQSFTARRDANTADEIWLLQHPPVYSLGVAGREAHLPRGRADIPLVRTDRGGQITYHGPGQLVAYPIIAISRRGLLVRPLVRALETAMIETCAAFGVAAARRDGHPGCWLDPDGPAPRKIGALGLRIERGVTYHGIALNVDPDLGDFELIDPCGMPDVVSTSIAAEIAGAGSASTATVEAVARVFARSFASAIAAELR